MPTVTITAANSERLLVRLQKRQDKAAIITTQGHDADGNPTIVTSFGPKVTIWPDQSLDHLASETRSYTVDDQNRVVVEQMPA